MISAFVAHDADSSSWTVISMIAFSGFLLAIAWSLLRPQRPSIRSSGDEAVERFARGEIDADEFERSLGPAESSDSTEPRLG